MAKISSRLQTANILNHALQCDGEIEHLRATLICPPLKRPYVGPYLYHINHTKRKLLLFCKVIRNYIKASKCLLIRNATVQQNAYTAIWKPHLWLIIFLLGAKFCLQYSSVSARKIPRRSECYACHSKDLTMVHNPVISVSTKKMTILKNNRHVVVTKDRLKPAYMSVTETNVSAFSDLSVPDTVAPAHTQQLTHHQWAAKSAPLTTHRLQSRNM